MVGQVLFKWGMRRMVRDIEKGQMRFWIVIILVQLVMLQENIQRMMRSLAGGMV